MLKYLMRSRMHQAGQVVMMEWLQDFRFSLFRLQVRDSRLDAARYLLRMIILSVPSRNGRSSSCLRGLFLGIGLPVLSGFFGRVLPGRLLGNGITLGSVLDYWPRIARIYTNEEKIICKALPPPSKARFLSVM